MSRRRVYRGVSIAAAASLALVAGAGGASGESAPSSALERFGVQAQSLGCGRDGARIMCSIAVGFSGLDRATSYQVTVTGPDGSVSYVADFGPEGGVAWVEYAGDGNYAIEVQAFGPGPEGDEQSLGKAEAVVADREQRDVGAIGDTEDPAGDSRDTGDAAAGLEPAPSFPGPELTPPPGDAVPGEPAPAPTPPAPVEPEPVAPPADPQPENPSPPPAEVPPPEAVD